MVARRHDHDVNALFRWRHRYGASVKDSEGSTMFVPAVITNDATPQALAPMNAATGSIVGSDGDRAAWRVSIDRGHGLGHGGAGPPDQGAAESMVPLPPGVRVWLATGYTDMRKGHPIAGAAGPGGAAARPAERSKRLERGRFLWPSVADGVVTIKPAQLGYLLSGIDWRHPRETWRPSSVG